jgi:hypothetical protein
MGTDKRVCSQNRASLGEISASLVGTFHFREKSGNTVEFQALLMVFGWGTLPMKTIEAKYVYGKTSKAACNE